MIRRQGSLAPATWEEALTFVGQHLRVARSRKEPQGLSIVVGDVPAIRDELWTRFARAFGTPNLIRIQTHDRRRASVAERLVYGAERPVTYDWERADLVLSFAVPLLDGGSSPVRQARQRAELRRRGGRIVQIESRLSATAARADQWLAVAPGSESAIALALARIVVERGRHDPSVESAPGFRPWSDTRGERQPGFNEWLQSHYDLDWCATVTGVPVARLEALTADLLAAERPLALFDPGGSRMERGLYSDLAVAALNLVLGAPGRTGGVTSSAPPPLAPTADPEAKRAPDPIADPGMRAARADGVEGDSSAFARDEPVQWAERCVRHDPSRTHVVLIDGVDPIRELPNGASLADAFDRGPLVVALAAAPNATTDHADVVLPVSHFLEHFSEEISLEEPGLSVYSVARPVVKPSTDSRSPEEIVTALGEAVGPPMTGLFAGSIEEAIAQRSAGLFRSGRGRIGTPLPDRVLRRALRERYASSTQPISESQFLDHLFDTGVWVETASQTEWKRPASFGGPRLDRELDRAGLLRDRIQRSLREPKAIFLPHYEGPLAGEAAAAIEPGVALPMIYFETAASGRTSSRAPWLRESQSPTSPANWSMWIELNPRTARDLGVYHMQRVRVLSVHGELIALASLTETARPGYVYVPLGVDVSAEVASRVDARQLSAPTLDPFVGVGPVDGTLVQILPTQG